MGISAIIITKNEEKMLSECLDSLGWADELLVIDTGSIDKTIQIAKKHGARVVDYSSGKNFSDWRNMGLQEAKTDWLFYIDADERVPKLLKDEILAITNTNANSSSVYAVPRQNIILGKAMRHGGWWPDYVERLFKKDALTKWKGELHERPLYKGELGYLANYLIHNKHETLSEMVEKTNLWSESEAKLMFEANHPPMTIPRFITAITREFWSRMIRRQAFLDGTEGIIFALYQVYSRFISYAKLWEMQQNKM